MISVGEIQAGNTMPGVWILFWRLEEVLKGVEVEKADNQIRDSETSKQEQGRALSIALS